MPNPIHPLALAVKSNKPVTELIGQPTSEQCDCFDHYGSPRVHAELRAGGEKHGRKRIARLMRDAGLVGASRRRQGPITTRRDKDARPTPDLVDRDFTAAGPDQLWVGDITFVPTSAGFMYLAVVLDA